MRNLILFMPPELVIFMIIGAGLAMIVGARSLAATLLGTAMAIIFLPVLLAPLFEALPRWLLVVLLVFFALGMLRALFEMAIGKHSTDHMVGILAADVVRATLLAPFRLIGWLARRLLRQR
jgi:ABC-type multidrug transport system fused ATPase/permease subunit